MNILSRAALLAVLYAFSLPGQVVSVPAGDPAPAGAPGTCAGMDLGLNADLHGFVPFPASTGWRRDISGMPADPKSAVYVAGFLRGQSRRLRSEYPPERTDLTADVYEGVPYTVVDSGRIPLVPITYDANNNQDSSDPGPFPVPVMPPVQGQFGPHGANQYSLPAGDNHMIILDRRTCLLYETFGTNMSSGRPVVGTSAVFDLLGGDFQRPEMLTSTSVSGLPLFAGMVRGDELRAGGANIGHAIAITGGYYPGVGLIANKSYTGIASHHQYGPGAWDPGQAPIGSVFRLRADYDVSRYPEQAQVLLNTLKKFGGMLTDGGLTADLYSAMSDQWDTDSTVALYTDPALTADNLEVVATGPVYCDPMYTCGAQRPVPAPPVISSFSADQPVVAQGFAVTLRWQVSGVPTRIRFVTPDVGPVVTDSVVVRPQVTTTYTLMVQNAGGRVSKTVTVTVTPPAPAAVDVAGPVAISAYFRSPGQAKDMTKFPKTGGYDYQWTVLDAPFTFRRDPAQHVHIGLEIPVSIDGKQAGVMRSLNFISGPGIKIQSTTDPGTGTLILVLSSFGSPGCVWDAAHNATCTPGSVDNPALALLPGPLPPQTFLPRGAPGTWMLPGAPDEAGVTCFVNGQYAPPSTYRVNGAIITGPWADTDQVTCLYRVQAPAGPHGQ